VIASPQRSWLQEKKPGPGPCIKPAHYVSLFSSPPVRRNLPHHGPALPFFTHHHHEIRPGALASDRPGDDAARLPLRKPRSNSDPAARSNKKNARNNQRKQQIKQSPPEASLQILTAVVLSNDVLPRGRRVGERSMLQRPGSPLRPNWPTGPAHVCPKFSIVLGIDRRSFHQTAAR
jgi:hypothetical protein